MTKLVPKFEMNDPLNIAVGDWLRIFRFSVDTKLVYEVAEVTKIIDHKWVEIQVHGETKRQILGIGVFKITRDQAMIHMLEND